MTSRVCKGCLRERKLVKSHIIPRAFYEVLRQDKSVAFNVITNKEGQYNSLSRIGAYDPAILCNECEERFKVPDDYAARTLLQRESQQVPITKNGKLVAYKAEGVEYQKIKFFVMTVLWRASISNLPIFSRVNLGPTEGRLKELIWQNETGGISDYPVILGRYAPSEHDPNLHRILFDPYVNRVQGMLYYRFFLGGYIADIQATSHIPPPHIRNYVSSNDLIIRNIGPFDSSPNLKLAIELLRNQTEN